MKDGNGNGPLHSAAFLGRSDFVELLLEKGADANVKNNNGETPMDSLGADGGNNPVHRKPVEDPPGPAQHRSRPGQARELLAKGGGKNGGGGGLHAASAVRISRPSRRRWRQGESECPGPEGGNDPACVGGGGSGMSRPGGLLIERGANVNGKNADGATPLHVAAFLGRAGVVELLSPKGRSQCPEHQGRDTVVLGPGACVVVPDCRVLQMEVDQKTVEQGPGPR
ncbi:MAG: hypothetical protein Ct9H300mP1_35570 [Planctomycetaceae bacterium]|nr:MAG: hypothetical protein Ct9H300mP1_35570 [Planctomycetaceae bacterium]